MERKKNFYKIYVVIWCLLITTCIFHVVGNICRSPIAEAVFENEMSKRGLKNQWEVESAAMIGYHTGKMPDHRALSTLKENGITNYSHRARQVRL